MAGAGATFLTVLLGVALAWRVGDLIGTPLEHQIVSLPEWTQWLALLLTPPAFAVLFQARFSEWRVIAITCLLGFVATRWGAGVLGPDLGPFLGALTVGVVSNIYARFFHRPASVPSMPAILLLVPGSLGYRSLTSFLAQDAVLGMEWGFNMALVGASLVGGLLAANVVVRSGAWFRYGEVQLGQGREKTRAYLVENPELLAELRQKITQTDEPEEPAVVPGEEGGGEVE